MEERKKREGTFQIDFYLFEGGVIKLKNSFQSRYYCVLHTSILYPLWSKLTPSSSWL